MVITCASHAQGPGFVPQRNQVIPCIDILHYGAEFPIIVSVYFCKVRVLWTVFCATSATFSTFSGSDLKYHLH